MDRTQLYATFDAEMARKTYSAVMGGGHSIPLCLLNDLAKCKSDWIISSACFINGWDLFETCVEAIIANLGIPQSHALAGRITDAIAEEIDLSDYMSSNQERVLQEILEYVGFDTRVEPPSKNLMLRLLDLVRSWGGSVPSSARVRTD